jgi:two-component system response regulator HydG
MDGRMSESLTILVVDDNGSMASTLADILSAKGFLIYAANSGTEALQILRDFPVDVMLTDVKMPDMNGVALYRKARKDHPTLTTFLMTAYAADDLIQQGMTEGVKTVLTKPLDIDLVISLLSAQRKLIKKVH